jgi:hypothetical protein
VKTHDDNWLEEKLTPIPPHPNHDDLRRRVLGETLRTFSRIRWRRRLLVAAGFLLCYLAGFATWHFIHRSRSSTPEPPLAGLPSSPSPRPALPAKSPRDLEWQAVEDSDRNAHLFREAGDRYLQEEFDPLSAVRCYRQALDDEGEALTVSPEDSWLLMAIKHARKKEKDDATPGI